MIIKQIQSEMKERKTLIDDQFIYNDCGYAILDQE